MLVGASQLSRTTLLLHVLFTNPDGSACEKPCLFGIRPGKVQQIEDKQRIEQLPWMKDVTLSNGDLSGWFDIAEQNATFFATANSDVAIFTEIRDGFVPQSISFPQPSLADVLATCGNPDLATYSSENLELWYENEKMFVYSAPIYSTFGGAIDPTTKIDGIVIYSSDALPTTEYPLTEWRGLSVARYIAR